MIRIIPTWQGFQYCRIWKVTEYRDGAVHKTKDTGFYVSLKDSEFLPEHFVTAAISTKLMLHKEMKLDVVERKDFNRLIELKI